MKLSMIPLITIKRVIIPQVLPKLFTTPTIILLGLTYLGEKIISFPNPLEAL